MVCNVPSGRVDGIEFDSNASDAVLTNVLQFVSAVSAAVEERIACLRDIAERLEEDSHDDFCVEDGT